MGCDCGGATAAIACRRRAGAATISRCCGPSRPALLVSRARKPMAQYVFTMNRVGKIVPPKRQILKNISLSLLPRRQDRRARRQRLGQEHAAQDHGRPRQGDRGRSHADARPEDRLPAAGAAARRRPDRARGGRGGHRRRAGREEATRRGLCRLRRARRRLRQAGRRTGRARSASSPRPAARTPTCSSNSPPTRCACRRGTRRSASSSGGEKRRVALCRLLLSKPDMLLLDEPTNHLDAESVDWLEQFLQRFPGTVVAITHDRYFLDNAAEWILELDRGSGIPWKGNYSDWLDQKEQRLEQEQKTEDARMKAMKEELKWVRSNAKGRQTKSKARLARFEELSRRRVPEAQRDQRDLHPGGRAPGQRGHRVQGRQQELRRPAADRQPELQGAGRRHRRHHRPQRRRQVDAVPHDPGQREARFGRGEDRQDRATGLRRPEPREPGRTTRRSGRTCRAGWTTSSSASS